MGYEPQMGKEDIRKLYLRLSADFASKPFDEVLECCRKIAKKNFSCFPLLFQIGTLLVNNSMESGDMDKAFPVITESKELFIRVKKESEDAELKQLALNMEAASLYSTILISRLFSLLFVLLSVLIFRKKQL